RRSSAALFPPLIDNKSSRATDRAAPTKPGLGGFGFQLLLYIVRRHTVDRDAARLHCFRDFPYQLNLEQAVIEPGALHLHVICEAELALEVSGRDASVKEVALSLVGFAAFDGDHVLLG